MDILRSIMYIVLVLFVLLYPQTKLCMECMKACYKKTKLDKSSFITSLIPLENLCAIRKAFYGKSTVHNTMASLTVLLLAFRLVVITFLYNVPLLMILSVYASIGSMLLMWALTAITTFDVARCLHSKFYMYVLCILVPPGAAYLLSGRVVPYIRKAEVN